MLFNTLLFLYLFLPICLFFVTIARKDMKNAFLLFASFIFYAWGGVSYVAILAGSTLANYFIGLALGNASKKGVRKAWFITGILVNVVPLLVFKYTGFFIENLNVLTCFFGLSPLTVQEIVLPLGISFYSFKAVTYLVSLRRGEVPVQRNYIDLALYIAFFPSVLSGPIDPYRTFFPQLRERRLTVEGFTSGIRRFALGLGKKMFIANTLAVVADQVFDSPHAILSTPLAWLGLICFGLQIYYDFSGYTDMAIGLGQMFGFRLSENFNFPYIAQSVKDFWRRWHLTLSGWLRDYIFLPIAYSLSRKMKKERYLSVRSDQLIYFMATTVTFFVCGFWHGAAWNFIVWGLLHGLMLIIEQFGLRMILKKLFPPLRTLYTLFFVMLAWVFFRTSTLADAFSFIGILFGGGAEASWNKLSVLLSPGFITVLVIALSGSTRIFARIIEWLPQAAGHLPRPARFAAINLREIVSILAVIFILSAATLFIVAGTNYSFIYFKF